MDSDSVTDTSMERLRLKAVRCWLTGFAAGGFISRKRNWAVAAVCCSALGLARWADVGFTDVQRLQQGVGYELGRTKGRGPLGSDSLNQLS